MSAATAPRRTLEEAHYAATVRLCRQILKQLALISDADAGRAPSPGGGVNARPRAESSIPRHVKGDGPTGPPPQARSLHAHFRFRMEQAHARRDGFLLTYLCAEAQRDMDLYRGTGKGAARRPTDSTGAVKRLLDEHRGLHPAVVVLYEHGGCDETWVRRTRVEYGCNPETGYPLEDDEDDVHARIFRLKQANPDWTLQRIGDEVGRDKGTVSRVLRGKIGRRS